MLCQPSGEDMTERKTLRGTPAMREAPPEKRGLCKPRQSKVAEIQN